jgi:hypothetical protein
MFSLLRETSAERRAIKETRRTLLIKASDPDASHARNPRINIGRHPLKKQEESQRALPHELDFNLCRLCIAMHLVFEAVVGRTACYETFTTTFLMAVEIAPLC